MGKKSYNAPFWVMLSVSVILSCVYIVSLIYVHKLMATGKYGQLKLNIWVMILPVLLWIETVLYRVIRKRIKNRFYVWAHIVLAIIGFIIVPAIFYVLTLVQSRLLTPAEYRVRRPKIELARFCAFWFLFIISHTFFITTIVKSFRKENRDNQDNEAAPGILDGIIEEY